MVKGAASQVLQVPPLKSGVYLGYSVCFDVYESPLYLRQYTMSLRFLPEQVEMHLCIWIISRKHIHGRQNADRVTLICVIHM